MAVLDDESKMRVALSRLLSTHGFEVAPAASWEELVATARVRLPDCLLLDLHMPGVSGFEVLARLTSRGFVVPTVVITGRDEPGNERRVRELGAVAYLLKPLDESTLVAAIHAACPTAASIP